METHPCPFCGNGPPEDANLRLLSLNVHTGASIRNGTLAELVKRHNPHVLLLQEVRRSVRRKLRRVLGKGWAIRGEVDSVVAVRKDRLRILTAATPDNTHGEQYERHVARVRARDKRTGRVVCLQSVHVQPLVHGVGGAPAYRVERQHAQLGTYLDWSERRGPHAVVVDGGDFNQPLRQPVRKVRKARRGYTVHRMWAKAGMRAAARLADKRGARLDDFMVRTDDHVAVKRHRVIPTHRKGDDHPAVLLVLRVTARY